MKSEDFRSNCPGKLIEIPEGVSAFVPSPLPPKIDLNDLELMKLSAEANLALGELRGMGRNLRNPYLLIGPLSYREAIVSCMLEGTIATAEEVAVLSARPEKVIARNEPREVRNYIESMNLGIELLKTIPVCKRLIRDIHARLLNGVRGQKHRPGEFRDRQNAIGREGQEIAHVRFVPPPANLMTDCLDEFETYLHSDKTYPSLIELALIHYQFEAIHPFMDGNGRIGRVLIILLLCHWGLLPQPLLYMSGFFERHKVDYKDCLLAVSQESAWLEWIKFFLKGVVLQSQDAVKRSDRLFRLQDDYRERYQSARSSALILKLVDRLFASPQMTMSSAATFLGVTNRSAQKHIDTLVGAGILYEATGDKRNRVYLAGDILDVINEDYLE